MPNTPLKYFMWAYQHHTRSNIERYAKELFGQISSQLKPTVFLLGILRNPVPDKLANLYRT